MVTKKTTEAESGRAQEFCKKTEADRSARMPMETREGALENKRGDRSRLRGSSVQEVGDGLFGRVKVHGVLKLAPFDQIVQGYCGDSHGERRRMKSRKTTAAEADAFEML